MGERSGAPLYVCGPTVGCGKAFAMVPAPHVFPPSWTLPERCPHCGMEQHPNTFIAVGPEPRERKPLRMDVDKDRFYEAIMTEQQVGEPLSLPLSALAPAEPARGEDAELASTVRQLEASAADWEREAETLYPAGGDVADRIIGAVCDLDPTDYPDDDPDTLRVSRADLRVIVDRETATLTERLARAEAEAARYRFLRDHVVDFGPKRGEDDTMFIDTDYGERWTAATIDEAVDEALRAAAGGEANNG